jgi:cytidine deaminase
MDYQELIERAAAVARKYQPSDDCEAATVGAAVLTVEGEVFTGCSVHLPCGLGFCAEHAAVARMLEQRRARIRAVVAVLEGGVIIPPCGRCRELLYKVHPGNLDTEVVLARGEVLPLRELLPHPW